MVSIIVEFHWYWYCLGDFWYCDIPREAKIRSLQSFEHTDLQKVLRAGSVFTQREPLTDGSGLEVRHQSSFRWRSNGDSGHSRLQREQSVRTQQKQVLLSSLFIYPYIPLLHNHKKLNYLTDPKIKVKTKLLAKIKVTCYAQWLIFLWTAG